MCETDYLKMKVFFRIFTILCICFRLTVQETDDINKSNINATKNSFQIYMDPQFSGFNLTNITSGPVIIKNQRTIFITSFRYFGLPQKLQFWIGINSDSSNDSEKQLVFSNFYDSNPVNFDILLPKEAPINAIKYLEINSTDNHFFASLLFPSINTSLIKPYNNDSNEIKEDYLYRFPKCCESNQYYSESDGSCINAIKEVQFNIKIFESNETGLDPDVLINSTLYKIIPFYQPLICQENEYLTQVDLDVLYGLIYNSSLIVKGDGIYSLNEYCLDITNFNNGSFATIAVTCFYVAPKPIDPNIYVPMLFISTICFALSAAAYKYIISGREDIHKRCFIIFSTSMCFSFISLIVMQMQGNLQVCNFFGFIFLFTVVLSFLWLFILCLELLYQVIYPIEEQRYKLRWYWYWTISLSISFLIVLISLFSADHWIPDVPNSFIMDYGDRNNRCNFNTSFPRAFITFVPMIVSILGSFASLIALEPCINKNENKPDIHYHYDWVTHYNSYKFLSRTYIIIIAVAAFWLLNIFFYSHQLDSGKTQLALDVIKASLGLVTFIGFVGNKYIRNEICRKFRNNKSVTEEDLKMNGLSTASLPDEEENETTNLRNNGSNNLH